MPVGLCVPRCLLKVLGCIWLAGILLDIEVVLSFSPSHQGVKVSLREEQQHQPKTKWKEHHIRTYLSRRGDNNLVSRWSSPRQDIKKQQQPKPKWKEQRKTSLYWGGRNNLSNPNASVREMTKDIYSLESIRQSLTRQEETLIFALIERAAFRHNEYSYTAKNFMLTPDPQVRTSTFTVG